MTKKSVNTNKNTIKIIINNDKKKRKRNKSKKILAKSKFRTPLGTPSQPAGQGVVSSSGLIPRIIPRGVSVGSTGLLDDYSTLAREYNNPLKITPKDVETPSTTKGKPEETTVKKLRDATASEKADLMALSLPHLRTAIKVHHPSISHSELRSINKSNKENYIDNLFGFPPSRPVAGEARKRFSDIDTEDDDEPPTDVPVRGGFKTPRGFQGQRPPSASVENFDGDEGVSSGSGFLQPEDDYRLQQQNFDNLPPEMKDILNPQVDDDAHAPIPHPPPPPPPKAEAKEQKKKERKEKKQEEGLHANITMRAEQKHEDPFDIHLTDAPKSNRRDSFLDSHPVSGGGGFSEQKALSAPSKTIPRTPPTVRVGKGTYDPNTDEESIMFGSSAVKQSPQALSRKAVDEAREEVRHQSDLLNQAMGKQPARRVSIKVPVDTSKAAITGSGFAIPSRRGTGRPKSDGN